MSHDDSVQEVSKTRLALKSILFFLLLNLSACMQKGEFLPDPAVSIRQHDRAISPSCIEDSENPVLLYFDFRRTSISELDRYFYTMLHDRAPENSIAPDNILLDKEGLHLLAQGDLHPIRQRVGAQLATKAFLGPGSLRWTARVSPSTGAVWAPWTYYYNYNEGIGEETNHEIDWESPSGSTYETEPSDQRFARVNTWLSPDTSTGSIVDLSNFDLGRLTEWRYDWRTAPTPQVSFYINGELIHTTTTTVPWIAQQMFMSFWFAHWAGKADFEERRATVETFSYMPFVGSPYAKAPAGHSNYGLVEEHLSLMPSHEIKRRDIPAIAVGGIKSSAATQVSGRLGNEATVVFPASTGNVLSVADGEWSGSYRGQQLFLAFDTSSIGKGEEVIAVTLTLHTAANGIGSNETVLLVKHWGPRLQAGDWITPEEASRVPVAAFKDEFAINVAGAWPDWRGRDSLERLMDTDGISFFVLLHRRVYDASADANGVNESFFMGAGADVEPRLTVITRKLLGVEGTPPLPSSRGPGKRSIAIEDAPIGD